MQAALLNPASSSADYRRQARRIRASFRGNSFLTQQALHDLAKRRNSETNSVVTNVRPVRSNLIFDRQAPLQSRITAVVERGFTEHALTKLQPFGFTFSDRTALLDAGERLENDGAWGYTPPSRTDKAKAIPSLLVIFSIEILIVAAVAGWFML